MKKATRSHGWPFDVMLQRLLSAAFGRPTFGATELVDERDQRQEQSDND